MCSQKGPVSHLARDYLHSWSQAGEEWECKPMALRRGLRTKELQDICMRPTRERLVPATCGLSDLGLCLFTPSPVPPCLSYGEDTNCPYTEVCSLITGLNPMLPWDVQILSSPSSIPEPQLLSSHSLLQLENLLLSHFNNYQTKPLPLPQSPSPPALPQSCLHSTSRLELPSLTLKVCDSETTFCLCLLGQHPPLFPLLPHQHEPNSLTHLPPPGLPDSLFQPLEALASFLILYLSYSSSLLLFLSLTLYSSLEVLIHFSASNQSINWRHPDDYPTPLKTSQQYFANASQILYHLQFSLQISVCGPSLSAKHHAASSWLAHTGTLVSSFFIPLISVA